MQRRKAAKSQRDEWKLASHEVAGQRWKNNFRAARHDGIVQMFSGVLSGRDGLLVRFPATMWLANFRLSLSGRFVTLRRETIRTDVI
jgi:hypothetical protein